MWIFLFKLVLFAPEMVVQNNLVLQIVEHLVTYVVCFMDAVSNCPVSRLEFVQRFHLLL